MQPCPVQCNMSITDPGAYLRIQLKGALSPDPLPSIGTRGVTYEELNSYDGPAFVEELYFRLLHRSPDPDGFRSFLKQLKAGTPKAQLIRSMLASNEAQEKGAIVLGLPSIPWYKRLLQPFSSR